MPDALLQTFTLRKEFGGLVAVDDVDFLVPEGSIVSLIGPNGAGKTTFFNMLTGVYKPTSGTVTLLGEDVTGKPPHAITARGVGRTFQNIRLFQNMTALENVLVSMHSRLKANLFNSIARTPGVRREEAVQREVGAEAVDREAGVTAHRRALLQHADAADAARAHGLAEHHLDGCVQRHVVLLGRGGGAHDDGWSRRGDS